MRVLKFVLILAFIPAFSFAQRGGGHGGGMAGGGGFHGGGGMSGGGMSRGGMVGGAARPSMGGTAMGGGVYRGGVVSGGVYRGGTFNSGFNNGFNHGFNNGFNHGFVNNRFFVGNRTFVGFGFGWPFWGFGWGWPSWGWGWPGWGWSGWGWPGWGWSAGYSDPSWAGYASGTDPYAYNAYGGTPDGYGSNPSQPVVINQNFAPTPPAPGSSTESYYRKPDYYLIAFSDHTIVAAITYRVEGDELYYTTREHEERHVPLSSIDRRFTEQINRDRHIDIRLP